MSVLIGVRKDYGASYSMNNVSLMKAENEALAIMFLKMILYLISNSFIAATIQNEKAEQNNRTIKMIKSEVLKEHAHPNTKCHCYTWVRIKSVCGALFVFY
jgi:hypothetical protein